MKKNFILFLFLAFCSCTSEKNEEPADIPMKFTANAETASFSGIRSGTVTGIYVVSRTETDAEGFLLPSGNAYDNQKFTFSDKVLTPDNKIYFPQGIPAFDIYAYAPYSGKGLNEDVQLPFTVATEQTDIAASDLLWATGKSVLPTSQNTLTFNHVLSKLEINLTAGIGVSLASTSVSVNNSLPTTLLDMKTGIPGNATGEKVSIQAMPISSTSTTAAFEAIIVPQTIVSTGKFLTIVNDGKTYYYDLSASKVFKKGTVYKYNLTINANDLEINLSGEVSEWTPGDSTDANLTKN